MNQKANKWLLPALLASGSLVALASFYVAYYPTPKDNVADNSGEPTTITANTNNEAEPVEANNDDAMPTVNEAADSDYIEGQFAQLGNFVKTEGKWKQNALLVSSDGDVTYRSDAEQMTITLKHASFSWNENRPQAMSDPTVDNMDITIAWPMVDPHFAEMDDFWDVLGTLNIRGGRITLVNALNESQEIISFAFKDLKQEIGSQYIGRVLDNIVTGVYDLSVHAMLGDTIEQTQKTAENFLQFLLGMPIKIGNIEGDIANGDLIFEDITIGESDDPLMTFASGKIKYALDASTPKNTQLVIDNLELFEPTAYVKFSDELNADGQPNENILPVLQRVTSQYDDLNTYRDNRLYIPIVYKNIAVSQGIIVTKQKDNVKRTQFPKLAFNQEAFNAITEAGTSPTYGLVGGYLGNLGQASLMIISGLIDENAQPTTNSEPPTLGSALDSAISDRLGLTDTNTPVQATEASEPLADNNNQAGE
ncbi:MAG: hypothetical protein ACK5LE_05860 [Alphaproteobacteria bacterium]